MAPIYLLDTTIIIKQAGAELGQAQVIIEVLVEVGVTLMLKL